MSDAEIQLDVTRRWKERSSWILSLGDWVSGADTSEFIVRVKLPTSSGRKKNSVGMDNTCWQQGSYPADSWFIYDWCLGQRSELEDVDLRIVTSCGSDAINVIAQRVWREKTGQEQTPGGTSIHLTSRERTELLRGRERIIRSIQKICRGSCCRVQGTRVPKRRLLSAQYT